MKYNIDFNISGALFLIIFYIFLKKQYTTNIQSNKKFRYLILAILFADIMDMLTAITISYSDQVPVYINYILNVIYFISSAGTGHVLLVYIRYIMEPDGKRHPGTYINDALYLVYTVLAVSSPFTHVLFYFDENNIYSHGPLYLALFILPIYYILYSLPWVIIKRRIIKKNQLIGIIMFVIISLIGASLQMIFFTDMLLSYYTSAMSAFIIMFSLETPHYQDLLRTMNDLEEAKSEAENARKEADKANKTKSDFLANMSHEIRTPLNGINGLTHAALDTLNANEFNDKTREEIIKYLNGVYDAGNNLLSIINDILDISKIESGKMELVNSRYQMSSLIASIFNMLAIKANEKSLCLKVTASEDIPDSLYGDEVRLRQIMINLINNAIKYTKKGEINVDISHEILDQDQIKLIIKVTDTGIGIKQEDISKLFGNFQRVDIVSNRNIEGTGLGLRITKQLSLMMGGDVTVESTYGNGSVFTATVIHKIMDNTPAASRIVYDSRKEDNSLGNIEKIVIPEKPDFSGKCVLVVDDVEINIVVMNALLKDLNLEVHTAMSGTKSLELTSRNKYDLIFMDHMMPEPDGIETFELMKKSETDLNKNTPVIMLTANAITGAEEEYLGVGFTDYLTKPVEAQKLYQTFYKYLK